MFLSLGLLALNDPVIEKATDNLVLVGFGWSGSKKKIPGHYFVWTGYESMMPI